MAIETMLKVRVAAHKSVAEEIWGRIQTLGCCQVITEGREKTAERDAAAIRAKARRIDSLLSDVRFVMRFLEPYIVQKGGGLAKALGDLPVCSQTELASRVSEEKILETVSAARALEKRASDTKSSISKVTGLISSLAHLSSLPYSLDFYTRGTDSVQGNIFSVPAASADEFKSRVDSSLGGDAEIYALPGGERDVTRIVSVICSRPAAEKFQSAIAGIQVSRIEVPAQMTGLARDEISRLENELRELKKEEAVVSTEIGNMAKDVFANCEQCSDKWSVERERLEAILDGEQTEQMIVESFWMPEKDLGEFQKTLKPWDDLMDIEVSKPSDDDEPPILLKNKKYAAPMEPVVEMFGLPGYKGLDPTWVVAPFFYIFFGICFGDAAYGGIVALAVAYVFLNYRVEGVIRKFLAILLISNLCAVAFGAITFSWFGDSIASFSFLRFLMPLEHLKILDPMSDPMTMLFVSLTFGFVQIFIGIGIAMYDNIRSGNKFAAFADQGGWMIFLASLVLLGLASTGTIPVPAGLFKVTSAVGAIILVATQGRDKKSILGKLFSGVLSLYGVTSYLGDLLSYSRLLALGLSSAAIGAVINLLANLVSGVPYVGVLFGILIFVLGHSFGIAVNLLGSFVHSMRLQYVEFFGKFYTASGEEFSPLSMKTQYVRITGD